jgi:hypothetical protein
MTPLHLCRFGQTVESERRIDAHLSGPSDVAAQNDRPPLVAAMEWVAKITTVALEMVLPGIAGGWLDAKLGTSFIALVGFALGVSGGVWHLLVITASGNGCVGTQAKNENRDDASNGRADS